MNKTVTEAFRQSRNKWRARAQMMLKVICGMAVAIAILTVTLFIQMDSRLEAEETCVELYGQLIEVTDKYNALLKRLAEPVETKQEPVELVQVSAPVQETNQLVNATCIGEYTITYYCACEKCCGQYGANRPVVNGRKVVTTSTGAFAQEGITVAVDPEQIPYGTLLYIDGLGYRIAQDCGGAIKGNRIDVYMESHEGALEQGKHTSQVYVLTGGTNND